MFSQPYYLNESSKFLKCYDIAEKTVLIWLHHTGLLDFSAPKKLAAFINNLIYAHPGEERCKEINFKYFLKISFMMFMQQYFDLGSKRRIKTLNHDIFSIYYSYHLP